MARKQFHVTYSTVTPESAEHSDYAECGFMTPYGRQDLEGLWGEAAGKVKAECALTLSEAVLIFGDRFHPGYLEDNGNSLRAPDPEQDYRTGESTTYTLHVPDGQSTAALKRYLERH